MLSSIRPTATALGMSRSASAAHRNPTMHPHLVVVAACRPGLGLEAAAPHRHLTSRPSLGQRPQCSRNSLPRTQRVVPSTHSVATTLGAGAAAPRETHRPSSPPHAYPRHHRSGRPARSRLMSRSTRPAHTYTSKSRPEAAASERRRRSPPRCRSPRISSPLRRHHALRLPVADPQRGQPVARARRPRGRAGLPP